MRNYLEMAATPANLALQSERGSLGLYDTTEPGPAELTDDEIDHLSRLDTFFMATVNEVGWPYVQHRGGAAGFVTVIGPTTIGWVERTGNRQYLGTGNIRANGRVALIFVDTLQRTRLKLFGEATFHESPDPDLLERLGGTTLRNDGAITVDVVATSWNCPKFITPRVPVADVEATVRSLEQRIAELEAENARLRSE